MNIRKLTLLTVFLVFALLTVACQPVEAVDSEQGPRPQPNECDVRTVPDRIEHRFPVAASQGNPCRNATRAPVEWIDSQGLRRDLERPRQVSPVERPLGGSAAHRGRALVGGRFHARCGGACSPTSRGEQGKAQHQGRGPDPGRATGRGGAPPRRRGDTAPRRGAAGRCDPGG